MGLARAIERQRLPRVFARNAEQFELCAPEQEHALRRGQRNMMPGYLAQPAGGQPRPVGHGGGYGERAGEIDLMRCQPHCAQHRLGECARAPAQQAVGIVVEGLGQQHHQRGTRDPARRDTPVEHSIRQ